MRHVISTTGAVVGAACKKRGPTANSSYVSPVGKDYQTVFWLGDGTAVDLEILLMSPLYLTPLISDMHLYHLRAKLNRCGLECRSLIDKGLVHVFLAIHKVSSTPVGRWNGISSRIVVRGIVECLLSRVWSCWLPQRMMRGDARSSSPGGINRSSSQAIARFAVRAVGNHRSDGLRLMTEKPHIRAYSQCLMPLFTNVMGIVQSARKQ